MMDSPLLSPPLLSPPLLSSPLSSPLPSPLLNSCGAWQDLSGCLSLPAGAIGWNIPETLSEATDHGLICGSSTLPDANGVPHLLLLLLSLLPSSLPHHPIITPFPITFCPRCLLEPDDPLPVWFASCVAPQPAHPSWFFLSFLQRQIN